MRKVLSVTAILLIVSLLLSLTACVTPTVPTTGPTAGTTTPATTAVPTTEAPNEGLLLYQSARGTLEAQKNVGMTVAVTETMTLPAETFTTNIKQDVTYVGIGTDTFEAMVTDSTATSQGYLTNQEIYSAGKVFITTHGLKYLSEMTVEDYIARYLPVILIDETLYGTLEYTTGSYSTEIRFSDPAGQESWIPEGAVVTDASGTATVNPDGKLTKYTYDVTYTLLGATIRQEINVNFTASTMGNVIEPTDTTGYLALSHPDVVKLAELAYYRAMASATMTGSSMIETVSNAAAVVIQDIYDTHSFYSNDYMAQVDFDRNYSDMQTGESGSYKLQEIFRNNAYTISTNGGAASGDPSVDADMMFNYVREILVTGWVDYSYMTECEVTNLGNVILIEFKGTEELAKLIEDDISSELFESESFLDDMASKYETKQMDFYIAIDTYFGLPTAAGYTYSGYHIIDGVEYPIAREVTSSLYLASNDAYEAITGNAMPDTDDAESPAPLFYHVTGANGEEMWLLGTIHVGDSRTGYLPQQITDALYSSDALAVECNPDVMEKEMEDPKLAGEYADAYYYSDNSTVQDHISDAEMYEFALDLMKATGNYTYYSPYLKVPIWESSISGAWKQMSYTLSSDKGVDNRLMKLAKNHNIPIREVESNLFQLKMLTGWSDALAENLLGGTLSTELHLYAADLMELYTMWCEGDEAALKEYLASDTSDLTAEEKILWEEYNKAMDTDRNKHMAEVAIEYLESGDTIFYAVGLAHVIAEDGLVNALRAAGYTVELVTYN